MGVPATPDFPALLFSSCQDNFLIRNLSYSIRETKVPLTDPLHVSIESPTGTAPSQPIGPMEVLSSGFDRSFSMLEPERRYTTAGHPSASSMPCGADVIPDGCPPSDAEVTRVDGPPCFDAHVSLIHSPDDSAPGGVSAREAERDFSGVRGTFLFGSSPPSTWEQPIDYSPQAGPTGYSPSKLAVPLLPRRAVLDPDATPSGAVSVPSRSEDLPQPPPEVAALLTTHSSGSVVSPLLARNSPLVSWELPSEIGYFWLGLFRIIGVKVDPCLSFGHKNSLNYLVFGQVETHRRRATTKALMVQCTWRFSLEWVPGGEDQLRDEEQGNYDEWTMYIMRPWWEPEHLQRPVQGPLFEPFQSVRYSYMLLPLPLLAPFTDNSTATGVFPAGYYCTVCGRVNVQRFLRHRICEGAACDSRTDPQRETGWAICAFSTRDRKVNSATVVPDDKWAAPMVAEPATAFEDGACLFHYHMAIGDSGPSLAPSIFHPSGAGADVHTHTHSVRHVFNGNKELLQVGASALFETLQRDVRIERRIGASAFATPQIESGDDPALGPNGRGIWDQQVAVIEGALSSYCADLGPLKVRALRVHAWISDGKVRTPCAVMLGQALRTPARCACSTFKRFVHAPSTLSYSAWALTLHCSLSSQTPTQNRIPNRSRSTSV